MHWADVWGCASLGGRMGPMAPGGPTLENLNRQKAYSNNQVIPIFCNAPHTPALLWMDRASPGNTYLSSTFTLDQTPC